MVVPKSQSRPAPFVPDDRQREAIEHVRGPMLVVAGAGTGKTSVLTQRIAQLVSQGHARPDEILALTYTKNAAAEMRDRVRQLLGGRVVRAATFHDYCYELLVRHGKKFGVLDDKDLWIFLRKRMHDLRLEYFVRAANVSQFLNDLLEFLCRCHDELVTPAKYAEYVQRVEAGGLPVPRVAKSRENLSDSEVIGRCREIARVFTTTERWLQEENLGTFSHMITRAHELLTTDQNLLREEQAAARFILVDEFQDANFAQIKLLAALAGEPSHIFAVGDPDQAIYRFRGASSAAFQLFHRHFPSAKLVVLGKNRRSLTPILRNAFALIDKNPPVFGSTRAGAIAYRRAPLQSAREEEASKQGSTLPSFPVEAISFAGRDAEGPDVVGVIEEMHRRSRCRWKDFGILYRLHGHRDDVVQQLAEKEIPFSIECMDVSDTPEVRDLFACLAVVVDMGDDGSLFRVAAVPNFTVDGAQLRTALRTIAKDSREGQVIPLASVLGGVDGGREVLETVLQTRDDVASRKAKGRNALEIIARAFDLDPTSAILQAALKFVGDWEEKDKAVTQTGEINELVQYLGYFREAGGVIPMTSGEDQDAVRLMTVHTAKGLEFDHVFILRAMKGSFPLNYRETLVEFPLELRDPDSAASVDDKTLFDQEERRLFYVAMTRARDSLHLYGKQGWGNDKSPPGLMRELMKDPGVQQWLRCRPALPSQPELIEIAAAADPAYARVSRTSEWLELPPVEGLSTRLSASAVDTYERCPLQFKLEREWRLSREVPAAMQYGASMHRILRTYSDAVRLGRPKTDAEILELFRADLTAAGIQDPYQQALYEKQGVEQLTNFLAAVRSSSAPEVLHTEEWFEVQIAGTTVAGRIDRIDRAPDGSVMIVDYKTGKARSQDDADESLQLSIYALAAQAKWGYRVAVLAFHNLEENIPVVTRRSEFQLAQARERVEAAARNIAAGDFEPKPDFHCNYCSFRGLCPAKEKRIPNLVKPGNVSNN
ncbi:MAG: ATP-dependent DNA helicase [Candidatus Sulfotelmatobacter sp.]